MGEKTRLDVEGLIQHRFTDRCCPMNSIDGMSYFEAKVSRRLLRADEIPDGALEQDQLGREHLTRS